MWNSNMANFVLVHGSAHGSWCWERVVPLLKEKGHRVVAVDLPGNGNDDTPLSEVTLETYARHVCAVLDSLDSPAVVVGHSLGGLTISRTAELRPGGVSFPAGAQAAEAGALRGQRGLRPRFDPAPEHGRRLRRAPGTAGGACSMERAVAE